MYLGPYCIELNTLNIRCDDRNKEKYVNKQRWYNNYFQRIPWRAGFKLSIGAEIWIGKYCALDSAPQKP